MKGIARTDQISRFDDRWCWLVASVVPRFRMFDDDMRLIDPSLRRILAQARDFASMPCVSHSHSR